MDVFQANFWHIFPIAIGKIAEADYVAIDLEMTGIRPRTTAKTQKLTISEVYQQCKEAAQTYQTLQLGITCLSYDENQDAFLSSSYNFHVSPMFPDNSNGNALARMVDRTLVVSYASLLFLRASGTRMEDSYVGGISYLSREDEENVSPTFLSLGKASHYEDIDLKLQDEETRSFYYDARSKIEQWEKDPGNDDFVNISNPHGGRINRFQQRLIYQLISNEFPGKYRCYCKFNLFMQVIREDDPEDQKYTNEKIQQRKQTLQSQKGLRYILEALVGGDFAKDTTDLARLNTQGSIPYDNLKEHLESSEKKLKNDQPVLIGHNMFMDLCFIYQTFFAYLPDSLPEFGQKIHDLFPNIIDTKYLTCQGGHDMLAANDLQELYTEANKQPLPWIVTSRPWTNGYSKDSKAHHAGYDSSITGTLFAKKTWEMANERGGDPVALMDQKHTSRLPSVHSEFFKAYKNKLRVANVGILDLETPEGI